jgi:glycosyltransferase involved in cell wall biosynthesis
MNKLSVVVPFRNRQEHLKKFVPHLKKFLESKNIDANIFIIEQNDTKPFNRGKLLNIGFTESKEEHNYFCFHDIDLLPVNDDCDYSYFDGVCKLSYYVSQFNFMPRPSSELGGVTMFSKESYIRVNGYSNDYWGWGVEDNDLGERCKRKDIPFCLRKGRYLSLPHKPNGDTMGGPISNNTNVNRKHFTNILSSGDFFESGLSDLTYEKMSEQKEELFTKISVNL